MIHLILIGVVFCCLLVLSWFIYSRIMRKRIILNIFDAARQDCVVSVVDNLCKAGGVNVKNEKGWDLLEVAAYYGSLKVCRYLIGLGATLQFDRLLNRSALLCAVHGNSSEAVNILIEAGVNYNDRLRGDESYLHLAVRLGRLEIAKIFIDAGLSVNDYNADGDTVLDKSLSVSFMGQLTAYSLKRMVDNPIKS